VSSFSTEHILEPGEPESVALKEWLAAGEEIPDTSVLPDGTLRDRTWTLEATADTLELNLAARVGSLRRARELGLDLH
jgi:hypothetical protein